MIGILNPYVWIGAAAVLAITNAYTFWNTWSWRDEENEKTILVARAEAEKRVRKEERDSVASVLALERNSVERLRNQVGLAGVAILEAKDELRKMPKCPVKPSTIGVLQPSTHSRLPVPAHKPAATPSDGPAVAPGTVSGAQDTVEAAELLATCKRNYELVCEPNRLQVLGLQEYVRVVYEACGAK